ncbi:MAG: ribonuclease P protein component [Proteobacteria bacterium]|nr:ribonuclease P protein component [Pseudomonadota bacterium]
MAAETFGFPRINRLCKPADYQNVFAGAQKSSDAYLTVLARASDQSQSRLGLAVSRKKIRNAVDRNRIKRLARESFRLHKAGLGNLDFVVMARTAARQADTKTLLMSLKKHWIILIKRCDSC